ncbi:hypothetical protein D3C76_945840 [compost metagenome]
MGHHVSGSKAFTQLKKLSYGHRRLLGEFGNGCGTQFFEHTIDNIIVQLPVVSAFRAQTFDKVFVAETLMKRDEIDMPVCG